MIPATGQLAVPPGFRFHPTDEELLYYYLRKKVAYEAIDLDVIREVDLNKLEPWDLKDKCRIGTGPQNEWYFFSHKDKKYPTGTRTNRATTAGFWKATGRDKAIHVGSCSRRIGMRKTLVFYTGRAPHGQKTDWIMHEYRLDDDCSDVQEDGWVVCRVFKKKNHHQRGLGIPPDSIPQEEEVHFPHNHNNNYNNFTIPPSDTYSSSNFDTNSLHLPQLLSTEPSPHPTFISPSLSLNSLDLECSHNLMKLTSGISASGNGVTVLNGGGGGGGDWSILDKLLASHQNLDQLFTNNNNTNINKCNGNPTTSQFPFQYLGCDAHELLKFSKLG